MKNLITFIYFIGTCFFSSCHGSIPINETTIYKSFIVTVCKLTAPECAYNDIENIEYQGNVYRPKQTLHYEKGKLCRVDQYGTEGMYSIQNDQTIIDRNFAMSMDVPFERTITLNTKTITDNTEIYSCTIKNDSIFVTSGNNSIYVYVITENQGSQGLVP